MDNISTSINLQNNMTQTLQSIINDLQGVISTAQNVENTLNNTFTTANTDIDISVNADLDGVQALKQKAEEIGFEVENNTDSQKNFNNEIRHGTDIANRLKDTIKTAVGAYIGIEGVKAFVNTSDELAQVNARLSRLLQDGESLEDLQNRIFASAQSSRGAYLDILDTVGKIGTQASDVFNNSQEVITFVEQLNKQFAISGASAEGQAAAMYQLTQAMGMGVLRGEELNSVLENANSVIETIADYLGVAKGKVKELASEGKITAEIVKNALLSSAEETNKEFEKMPKTFAQIRQSIENDFVYALQPALQRLNDYFNTEEFQSFVSAITGGLGTIATITSVALEIVISGFNTAGEAIEALGTPLLGLISIFALYKGMVAATSAAEAVKSGVSFLHARAQSAVAIATGKATAIQGAYNSMLWKSPIFIMISVLMIIITLIATYTQWTGKATNTTVSGIGLIVGAITGAIAIVENLFKGLVNAIILAFETVANVLISIAEFLQNVFIHPIQSVKKLFADLANYVLNVLKGIAGQIDAVFGGNLAATIENWQNNVEAWGTPESADYTIREKVDFSDKMLELADVKARATEAYNKSKDKNLFDTSQITGFDTSAFDNKISSDLDDLKDKTGSIDKAVNGEIEFQNEDLTYLREILTARAIQNFSFDKIVVEVNNEFGDVHETADTGGVISSITDGLEEAIAIVGATAAETGGV